MQDKLNNIANKIDILMDEYLSIVQKDIELNCDTQEILAFSIIYIPEKGTFIKLIR